MTIIRDYRHALILSALMLLSVLAPRSLCFAPLIAGVGGYLFLWFQTKNFPVLDKQLGMFFILIVGLGAASTLWSDHTEDVISRPINTGLMLGVGLLMISYARHVVIPPAASYKIFLASYAALALYFGFEYVMNFPIVTSFNPDFARYNYNRSLVVFTLLFPAVLYLVRKIYPETQKFIWVAGGLFLCTMVPIYLTQSQTAQMVMVSALTTYGILRSVQNNVLRGWIFKIAALIVSAGILLAPFAPSFMLKHTDEIANSNSFTADANMSGRLEIWNFVATKIAEKPLLGHGIEATRYFESTMLMPYNKTDSVLHPHNGLLQIWVEMGIAGALLACALSVFILIRISRAKTAHQPLFLSLFVGSLCLITVGYGVWQSWQLGLLLTIPTFCTLLTRIPDREKA